VTLLVVNYHYVAAEAPRRPRAIFPVTVARLEAQLAELGRGHAFVSAEDVLGAVEGTASLPERACLVTFDDGLRVQHELALPVLARLGVRALFLVPGRPLGEGRALYVHKVHALREEVGDDGLLPLLEARPVDADAARRTYVYDTPDAAKVKYLLNVALPLDEREEALGDAFARVLGDEAAFCERTYMSAEQVGELDGAGGSVGAHSYAHEPLALLEPGALRRDLESSADVLERVTGRRPLALSYPHGSHEAVTPEVAVAAEEVGFRVGFTMERALNGTLEQPLLLARLDANDAPGGSRPLPEVPDRSRYLQARS
jgi:peptidoglycan/xylan/chitin deacetylase (PgdA/CDA1 family)